MDQDNAPHSIAIWLRWEIHDRTTKGQLSGTPKDFKDYTGVIHCVDRPEALNVINELINYLKEKVKECQTKIKQ